MLVVITIPIHHAKARGMAGCHQRLPCSGLPTYVPAHPPIERALAVHYLCPAHHTRKRPEIWWLMSKAHLQMNALGSTSSQSLYYDRLVTRGQKLPPSNRKDSREWVPSFVDD